MQGSQGCYGLPKRINPTTNDLWISTSTTPGTVSNFYLFTAQNRAADHSKWVSDSTNGDKVIILRDGVYAISLSGAVRTTSGVSSAIQVYTWDYPSGYQVAFTQVQPGTGSASDGANATAVVTLRANEYVKFISNYLPNGGVVKAAITLIAPI
jgi:hypothetical protein